MALKTTIKIGCYTICGLFSLIIVAKSLILAPEEVLNNPILTVILIAAITAFYEHVTPYIKKLRLLYYFPYPINWLGKGVHTRDVIPPLPDALKEVTDE